MRRLLMVGFPLAAALTAVPAYGLSEGVAASGGAEPAHAEVVASGGATADAPTTPPDPAPLTTAVEDGGDDATGRTRAGADRARAGADEASATQPPAAPTTTSTTVVVPPPPPAPAPAPAPEKAAPGPSPAPGPSAPAPGAGGSDLDVSARVSSRIGS